MQELLGQRGLQEVLGQRGPQENIEITGTKMSRGLYKLLDWDKEVHRGIQKLLGQRGLQDYWEKEVYRGFRIQRTLAGKANL